MADFLSSEYCIFTPTRIRKYNCCYSSGHVTIYLKDGKVISASGSLPGGMNLQDAYQPENCTETQMGGGGNAPVHYRKANIPPQTTEFPSQNYDNVQEDKINIFPELIFLILYISFFIFIIGLLIYAAILSRQTKKVIKDAKELLKNKNSIKTNEYNSITEEYDYDNKFEYIKQEKKLTFLQ